MPKPLVILGRDFELNIILKKTKKDNYYCAKLVDILY
jgi:hypothetical protein